MGPVRKKIFDKRFTILFSLQVLMLALLVFVCFARSKETTLPETFKDIANQLQSRGLVKEAIHYYEKYWDQASLSKAQRATIAFSNAELYDQQGQKEQALAWYYTVKIMDPASSHIPEAAKRIVAHLESLGKVSAAKMELKSSTSLEGPSAKGAVVVAKIGDKNIYLNEINEAIDYLPPEIRKSFLTEEGKQNFLKKYVGEEILYDKAKRLGAEKNADLQKNLKWIERQLMVESVLKSEIGDKVKVDEQDLKNHFEAHKDKFGDKKKKHSYDQVKSQVEMDYRLQKSQKLYQELIEKSLKGENVQLFVEKLK